ncbi:MAG: hypothetical protein PUD59_05225 [bacterium]|nr:hypothetical protein [bacterium]
MKKNLNLLLIGFLLFIIGLISLGLELVNFNYVNNLPSYFSKNVESFTVNIDKNKNYEILRTKYNDNIEIKKIINNSLDDEIYIEVEHSDTSVSDITIKDDKTITKIIFNNDIKITNSNLQDIYNLVIDSIANKKMYNYNLLKYSRVFIYGNEENLSKIKIKEKYED